MMRDERANKVESTWAHDECDTRREGHVDKRHGVGIASPSTGGVHTLSQETAKLVDEPRDRRGVHGEPAMEKHREIDRELRRIAKQRAGLDCQEARWLREADRHQIWRVLGFSTALEYLEDVFGYAPRTALERLRVAKELGELPQLEAELASGALPYSAAKELSRVMTPETQEEWLARARGKNLRDIEEMVAGRKKGDGPDAPIDPELVVHEVRLMLTARTKALWEQMRAVLEVECDSHLDDDQLAEVVTRRVLAGDSAVSDKPPRPAHCIVVHKCDDCSRAWQETRGRWIQLPQAEVALAECDAMIVREDDQVVESAKAGASPTATAERAESKSVRATSDIPERTRKRVWARDKGRCCVPGCRATRHIDFHHLRPRALGGTHHESNLALTCSGHHKLSHAGILSITGSAPDGLVFIRDGKHLVDPRAGGVAAVPVVPATTPIKAHNRFEDLAKLERARQALRQLGLSARAARAALEDTRAHVGANADVAEIVQAAFERSRYQVAEAATLEAAADDAMKLATQALVQLGYPRPTAARAVNAARAHVGSGDLATLIKEALQRTHS